MPQKFGVQLKKDKQLRLSYGVKRLTYFNLPVWKLFVKCIIEINDNMGHINKINTSYPCHESWQNMRPVDEGKYCQSCCKTVVDFTSMSNGQIIEQLSAKNNICGRLYYSQIDNINAGLQDTNKHGFKWKGFMAAASIISLISFSKVYAKAKAFYSTEQAPFEKGKYLQTDTIFKTITGTITIGDTLKLANTNIYVKGKAIQTISNEKGEFTINVPISADTLEILWLPYTRQYVKIDPVNQSNYNINYKPVIDNAVVNGRDNGRVHLGEIRTKPGKRFNKALLMKAMKEIGTIPKDFK